MFALIVIRGCEAQSPRRPGGANEKQTVFSRLFCISLCYVRTNLNMRERSSKPARATRPPPVEERPAGLVFMLWMLLIYYYGILIL